ncbi:hypothetical protein VTH06DRAFT_2363 [Thermothelomyces fergusii]
MPEQYVLFDLPSKDPCRCWSLNPWKTRMLLNFKGVDYRTEWKKFKRGPALHRLSIRTSGPPSSHTWPRTRRSRCTRSRRCASRTGGT